MSDISNMYSECLRTHVDRMQRMHPERMAQLAERSGLELSEGGGNSAASAQDVVQYLDAVRQVFGTVNLMAAKTGIDQLLRTHEQTVLEQAKQLERLEQSLSESGVALKKQTQILQSVLDNIDDGIIVVDDKGEFLVTNPAALEMLGSEGMEGTVDDWAAHQQFCLSDGTTPCPRDEFPLRSALNGNTIQGQEMYLQRDGGIWLSISARPWTEDQAGLHGAIAVFHDLTKRKKTEMELIEARRLADQASTAKSQFLANMSHELRTPLNAIIGFSRMVLEDAQEAGLDDVASDQNKILNAGKQLSDLINNILDLSKIEAGKVEIYVESFDTSALISDVAVTVQPLLTNNLNTLEVNKSEDLGTMNSDLTKVRQCLFNLLSNACKFTEKDTITLDVRRESAPDGDYIVFSVRDQGIGMSPEQVHKIFDVFTQADASTTKKYGGTGLGLAISQRIAQMLGGEITVQSKLGEGSTFHLRVLAELAGAKVTRQATAAVPGLRPQRSGSDTSSRAENTILIIDDELVVRELIQRLVEKEGFQTVAVGSGEEGLECARQMKPFAITLDVLMPGMDGWAVLTKLKADPELAEIPVIIISIMDEKNLGYSLGASDYLIKPVEPAQLARVLEKNRSRLVSGPVLVVDDDADTREMLRRMLEKLNTNIVEAENGVVALEQLEVHRPALVLLDLMMPEMDGFEFLEALSLRSEYRDLPIVVLTSKTLTNADRERLSGQVEGVMEKGSVSTDELLAYLQRKLDDLRQESSAAEGSPE